IIPPSIVLILLGDVLSSSYQEAQRALGVTAPEALSVGDLFAGALLPGLGLVALYLLYQAAVAVLRPRASPAIAEEGAGFDRTLLGTLFSALIPPVVLIVAVLGSILVGLATATEAAAVGAVGAILLGSLRLSRPPYWPVLGGAVALAAAFAQAAIFGPAKAGWPFALALLLVTLAAISLVIALLRVHRAGVLGPVLRSSVRITVMVFTILVGAALFSLVFRGLGGDHIVANALGNLPGGTPGAIIVVMAVMFVLGFFLDFIEITFVVVPIVAPILFRMGVDPVWLGVMMAVNLQTSFLTPPFGFALFYLRGVAPKSLPTSAIYRGALPFVAIQILALLMLASWPELASWLPTVVYPR
ncbi:MAG: TRAP transporter large permease subunit, partial [Rhodothalassiaceae bacterium]